jgi:hypothetical protein
MLMQKEAASASEIRDLRNMVNEEGVVCSERLERKQTQGGHSLTWDVLDLLIHPILNVVYN